jgi:hypothetical protein
MGGITHKHTAIQPRHRCYCLLASPRKITEAFQSCFKKERQNYFSKHFNKSIDVINKKQAIN